SCCCFPASRSVSPSPRAPCHHELTCLTLSELTLHRRSSLAISPVQINNCSFSSGWFARDPSVLSLVGCVLLQSNSVDTKRIGQISFADDLFQLSKVHNLKTVSVIGKAIQTLTG
ncbi:hypothetical protein S245_057067, partial [Arachis hypogaea]